MNYYELKSQVAKIIPRMTQLTDRRRHQDAVREKGRKSGYQEFKIDQHEWVRQERLLNLEEINSFAEISCRAAACPMPLNLDVWDGLLCPFNCKYCFANAFRASLYTAFFDNSKTMGFRHCDPNKFKREMDKFMALRGKDPHSLKGDLAKAFAMELPVRFGIRFEDFMGEEKKQGVSLELLRYLADNEYPVMINTKSALVGEDEYVDALSSNPAGTAIHVTLISSNQPLLSKIEPGAPSYQARVDAMETLVAVGVRVVARIEPFLPFIADEKEEVQQYIEDMKGIGVQNITFDTYSYSANNPGIRQAFINSGIDWERIFTLGCDSQALGSLLLGKFMELFREEGFSCSTFDMGNAPDNNQSVCCEVGDFFSNSGFNYGCTVMAARFIQEANAPVSWSEFKDWVNARGGFLSPILEDEVHHLWNMEGNNAYSHGWARGIGPVGWDQDGMIWKYDIETDFRKEVLYGAIG